MKTGGVRWIVLVALALAATCLPGNPQPSCVPVEPGQPLCSSDLDCTWCDYGPAPRSTADCYCRGCSYGPMTHEECARSARAWERHCGRDVWPEGDLCDGDGICDEPPPTGCDENGVCVVVEECGDPAALARYDECRAAEDEPSCLAAGGWWTIVGLWPEPVCQCPTGQRDCPCTSSRDCRSACIGEFTGSGMFQCEGAQGHCSPVSLTVGCHCWFDENGEVMGICAD